MPDLFSGKHVLDGFIFINAAAGFLNRHLGQFHMMIKTGNRHAVHDLVDLLLVISLQHFERFLSIGNELVNIRFNVGLGFRFVFQH